MKKRMAYIMPSKKEIHSMKKNELYTCSKHLKEAGYINKNEGLYRLRVGELRSILIDVYDNNGGVDFGGTTIHEVDIDYNDLPEDSFPRSMKINKNRKRSASSSKEYKKELKMANREDKTKRNREEFKKNMMYLQDESVSGVESEVESEVETSDIDRSDSEDESDEEREILSRKMRRCKISETDNETEFFEGDETIDETAGYSERSDTERSDPEDEIEEETESEEESKEESKEELYEELEEETTGLTSETSDEERETKKEVVKTDDKNQQVVEYSGDFDMSNYDIMYKDMM